MRRCWPFRSPYESCYFVTPVLVNVLRGLIAAPLAIPAPGKKIAAARFPRLMSSGFSGAGGGNVPVNPPSPRIHARRPGLQSTTQRFTAGPRRRGHF